MFRLFVSPTLRCKGSPLRWFTCITPALPAYRLIPPIAPLLRMPGRRLEPGNRPVATLLKKAQQMRKEEARAVDGTYKRMFRAVGGT